jgi:hypothetical protein
MSYLGARLPGAAAMQQALDAQAPGEQEHARRLVSAETATARVLEQLGPGWRTLHCLPVGPGATLAHLLIGPAGVFAISSLPQAATVVDVEDGRARLSPYGCGEALAEVRQLAHRVRAGWVRRWGRSVDLPYVHPVVCLTAGGPAPAPGPGEPAEVVELSHLLPHVLHHPRRLTTAWVERLAALSAEPLTWDAPGAEWLDPDLPTRYDALPRSGPGRPMVVAGSVIESQPPRPPAEGAALRARSLLMVTLGLLSLGTVGLLSPPGLVLGAVTLRRHRNLDWLNHKDANLFHVGMVMTVLPLPVTFLALVFLGVARVQ